MESKLCTRCRKLKPYSEFSKNQHMTLGLQSQCKDCFAERGRISRYGKPCISCGKSKEVGIPKGAKLCMECAKTCYKCKLNPRRAQHRMCNPCMLSTRCEERKSFTLEQKIKRRTNRISSLFKIDRNLAYRLASQNECDACGGSHKHEASLHIDHCHYTGSVRGALCFNCNAALGHIDDSIDRLIKLVGYISKFKNGKEDLLKARHYIDLLIQLEYDS